MLYKKNVTSWEQVLRIVIGLAMMAGGLFALPGQGLGYAVAAGGLMMGMTGVLGYCPACGMVGRKVGQSKA